MPARSRTPVAGHELRSTSGTPLALTQAFEALPVPTLGVLHGMDLTIGFELLAESPAAGLLAHSSLSASAIEALICDHVG